MCLIMLLLFVVVVLPKVMYELTLSESPVSFFNSLSLNVSKSGFIPLNQSGRSVGRFIYVVLGHGEWKEGRKGEGQKDGYIHLAPASVVCFRIK